MPTITKNQFGGRQFGGSGPAYGNASALHFVLTTNATGAVENSDSTAAVASGDVVKIGVLPAGMTLMDAAVTIKTALTASVTGNLGFAYVDGVDDTDVPQDADYFAAAADMATAALLRKATATAPVKLPKDAWLTLTTGGAANAKASETHFVILGELSGPA